MKVISRIVIVAAAALLLANLPAGAACAVSGNSFTSTYYTGSNLDPSSATGNFWVIGNFDPATPTGIDNGTVLPVGWLAANANGVYLASDWASTPLYDGCPDTAAQPSKMAFAVSMPGAAPGTTVYIAGCDEENASGSYFFQESATDQVMAPLLKPTVQNSSRAAGTVTVTLAPPAIGGGVFDEAGCNLTAPQYRVYSQNTTRNGAAPASRDRIAGGWAPTGGPTPAGQPAQVTIPCVGDQDVYLAYSIIISDGTDSIELGHVGANSTVVQCGATSAEPPKNFKIIKKPVRTKTN